MRRQARASRSAARVGRCSGVRSHRAACYSALALPIAHRWEATRLLVAIHPGDRRTAPCRSAGTPRAGCQRVSPSGSCPCSNRVVLHQAHLHYEHGPDDGAPSATCGHHPVVPVAYLPRSARFESMLRGPQSKRTAYRARYRHALQERGDLPPLGGLSIEPEVEPAVAVGRPGSAPSSRRARTLHGTGKSPFESMLRGPQSKRTAYRARRPTTDYCKDI